jgi:hypothetical protein
MNDRQLRYAIAVWRERSFSKAAEQPNISQPSVSAAPETESGRLVIRAIRPPCAAAVTLIYRDGLHEFPVGACIEIIRCGLTDADGGQTFAP